MRRSGSWGIVCGALLTILLFGAAPTSQAQTPPDCGGVTFCSCSRPYDCYQPVSCTLPATGGLTIGFQQHLSGIEPWNSLLYPIVPSGEQMDSVNLPAGVTADMVTQHGSMSCGPPNFSCPTWPFPETCNGGQCELFSWQSPSDCLNRIYASRSSVYAPNPNGTSLYLQDCDHFGGEIAINGATAEGDVSSSGPFAELKGGPTGIDLTNSQGVTTTITLSRPTTCMSGASRVCADWVAAPPDSCWGRCGATAPSGCSCAPTCAVAGNCCADVVNFCSAQANALCVAPPAELATDRMGAVTTAQVGLVCSGSPCPTSTVTITATVDDPTQAQIKLPQDATYQNAIALTFPTGNSAPQTIQIRGRDDQVTYGDRRFNVNLSAASADSAFSGKSLPVVIKNVDRTDYNVCAPNVVTKFWAIPTNMADERKLPVLFQQPPFAEYGFQWCDLHPVVPLLIPCPEHFEGIGRTKKGPNLVVTGKGQDASHLMIHRLQQKDGVVGRWGGNFTTWDYDHLENPTNYVVSTTDDHAGGVSIFGDFAAVPLEGDSPGTSVVFYDLFDPTQPRQIGAPMQHPFDFAGAVAMAKYQGRYLMAVMTNDPAEVHFYWSNGGDIRQPQTWQFLGAWSTVQHGFPYACYGAVPAAAATIQNMAFVQDCGGPLYLSVTWNSGGAGDCLYPWNQELLRLYEVDVSKLMGGETNDALSVVGTKQFDCYSGNADVYYCNFAAAANLYVDQATRDLAVYAAHPFSEGLYTSTGWHWFMLAAEFASQMTTPTGVAATQNLADRVRVSWPSVAGAANYTVQRDGVPIATVTGSPYDDTTAPPCARSKYTVQATNAQGQSSPPSTAVTGFRSIVPVNGVPFAPALVAPSNGQSVAPPATLDWDPVCDALTYGLEVATSSSFSAGTIVYSANGLTDPPTSTSVSLAAGGTYYWRARGTTALGLIGAWSATRSFNALTGCGSGVCNGKTCTACPGDCSALVSPANAATGISTTPALDWSDLAGAAGYDVQIATDAGFNTVVRSVSSVPSNWTVSPALSGGTTYYWRVRATAACGAGAWTPGRSFTTVEVDYVDCGTSCVNLAPGKQVTYSALWNPTYNPATKLNDLNSGNPSTCEGSASQTGYCAIAKHPTLGQAVGNYFQIDLGAVKSVKSVRVFGRRDFALTQGQNLKLRLSRDGVNWTDYTMADTTMPEGFLVSTARQARYVKVETTMVVYLSLYEVQVNGPCEVLCSCGNGICDQDEWCDTCPQDCHESVINLPANQCAICDVSGEMRCGPGMSLWCCPY